MGGKSLRKGLSTSLLVVTLVSLGVAGGVRPVTAGPTARESLDSTGRQANGASFKAAISADGRFVVFESDATNLVLGDTTGKRDVFFHDLR